uniref:Chromosome partition protein Smc n=1 Tax=Wolbachia endosymbiont of Oeneis ivallda TaxID=3171168 RepID=A0AAU7YMP9_9RICK
MTKENLLVTENQGLDLDEQKKNDILSFIKSCKNFQDFIRKLEEENLIWYFICPLRKDENVKEQINLKWENEFQKFEQSITAAHKKFAESLPSENFLVYTTKDNDFQIRFENKEKPIEISTLLRASDEGKVYNLSLGKDSQITATKKGSERHYDFTGSSSCEMTINWQAKDSKGNSIDCSMTLEVNSKGIKRVIGEPKFGEITDPEEVLKLVEQNKEVFINGKTLHQAFTDIGKSVNEQQTPAEETFTKDSPQSATPSSSGYSSLNTPSSRRSSLSISSEFNGEDETFESNTFDEEENKQEGNELEEENTYLKKENAELKSLNTKITEEGEAEASQLIEGKQDLEKEVTRLKDELKRKEKELAEKDQDIKQLELDVNVLKQSQKDKNARITDLTDQLKDKKSEVQSTNRINEELQKKLDQGEIELSKLRAENTKLRNYITKTSAEGLKDNHEKQLLEELTEEKGKNNTLAKEMKQLSQEFNELKKRNENLEREIRQLEPGKSLADEMSEVTTKVATSTKTEVEYESRVIEASDHETTVPKTQDQGTNAGVDASSSTDQKEAKEEEARTNIPQNIMDWPVPIPDDKPEEQQIPLEPTKVNTELSDPKSTPAKVPEKSTPSKG